MLSDRCPALCCHVCPLCNVGVFCQTVGRIKMKLGMHAGIGLGTGHIVLHGDPAPPIFGPYLLWPNGWMDQDATWYGGRPQPRRLCARWGPSTPPHKGGGAPVPNFRPLSIVAKRLDASGGRPQPRRLCVRWGTSPLPKNGADPPNFRPMFIMAKRLD